ncbi:MAG: hypothetical protein LQ343_002733 [Gyalolechia ehrenbergii]|nr:MAG: hypothetical protein LQ343_002733 [Gyalolechia ehrenbergii]
MQQYSGIPDGSHDDNAVKLRLLTYSPIELERCGVDPAILEKNCPLDYFSDRIEPVHPKLHTALGALQVLPPELLHLILHDLDLHTLTTFRSVNKQGRHLVSSLRRYNAIVQHVPNTLRFILSTHAAATCTLSQLYHALLYSDCFICGRYGGFFSVLSCSRCCCYCLCCSDLLFPLTRRAAQTHFKLDKSSTNTLPVALSLPGRYGLQRNLSRKRNWIVLRASAHQAAVLLHGSERELASRISGATSSPSTAPNLSNSGGMDGYAVGAISLLRFQTVIRFPTLDVSTGALDWGIACQACRDEHDCKGPWQDRYKLYSNRQYYLQHFPHCDAAQQKWQEYLQSKGEVQQFYWPGTTKRSGSRILSSPR